MRIEFKRKYIYLFISVSLLCFMSVLMLSCESDDTDDTIPSDNTTTCNCESLDISDSDLVVNVANIDEQMVKVSKGSSTGYCDNGIVECCLFEFTAGKANQYYTGGIDAHKAKNWIVRNNTFKNIKSPETALAEHAIHFWSFSENTIVENNLIINCDRGIGFGLGESGHVGGIIRNNCVHTSRDVSIGLESASNIKVLNNTVHTENYTNSIEYRFSGTTGAEITNNLVSGEIASRNGGTGKLKTNYTFTDLSAFKDVSTHNYMLAEGTNSEIIDAGTNLESVKYDYNCEARPKGNGYDIGSDEL